MRPLEAIPLEDRDAEGQFGLRDVTGISDLTLLISPPALQLLALMDGERTCDGIRSAFKEAVGVDVSPDVLHGLLDHLEKAHFLEGPAFEAYYRSRVDAYRAQPSRPMRDPESLGIVDDGGALFDDMCSAVAVPRISGSLVGIVAPHLDYPRGAPCYGLSYGVLRERQSPQLVVLLGTNHFGRSSSVVATAADFSTPLGTTPCDVAFLEALEDRCGSLRGFELDHAREHSIELQVAWLQHRFGAANFQMVPFLCPDPCGPTGTAPFDGQGVDLRVFAQALGDQIRADPRDVLLVAGADLSHVGNAFGDTRPLEESFLKSVRDGDEQALARYTASDEEGFVRLLSANQNATRVCSAGCMYALAIALGDATPMLLGYHQAVDQTTQTCVTCCSVAFYRN